MKPSLCTPRLLLEWLFEMLFEACDVVLPELAILCRPPGNLPNSLRLELVKALPPFPLLADEPRGSQNPEMF